MPEQDEVVTIKTQPTPAKPSAYEKVDFYGSLADNLLSKGGAQRQMQGSTFARQNSSSS